MPQTFSENQTLISPQAYEGDLVLDPQEDPSTHDWADLEDRYLDLKDETWRLRHELNLDPDAGKTPENGGYAGPGGYLKK